MKVIINDMIFHSKKELTVHTRILIRSLGEGYVIDSKDLNYIYFMELIKRHCNYIDKVGPGVKYFQIQKDALNHLYIRIF